MATELDEINKSNAYKGTPKINLGDGASLKKALDDAAAEVSTTFTRDSSQTRCTGFRSADPLCLRCPGNSLCCRP